MSLLSVSLYVGAGRPPEAANDNGAMDFSLAAQSGLLAIILEDF